MRKLLLFAAVLFVAAIPAQAQDYPTAEIFGGYSYFNVDGIGDREHEHGWGLSLAGNVTEHIGFVAEFSGHYGETNIAGFDFDTNTHTFLFGPRISARAEAATGFVHALFGGARTSIEGFSDTNFAMALGGGVDINAGEHVAVRIFQLDWVPIRASGDWSHNFRAQFGLTFKLGNR